MHWDNNKHTIAAAIALAISTGMQSSYLSAQESLFLEEVIVTAAKRSESLRMTGFSG